MSYHRNSLGAVSTADLAAVAKGAASATSSGGLTAAGALLRDPNLPEVICRVNQLEAIRLGQRKPPCQTPPVRDGALADAVRPLRFLVTAKERPYVVPVAAVAVIGIPFLLGLLAGRRSRRTSP